MPETPAARVLLLSCVLALSPAAVPPGDASHVADAQASPLAGTWRVSLHEMDGVELDIRLTFAVTGRGEPVRWEAWSREGAAREMVGGGKAFFGRLLGQMPPKGALIHIGEGVAENDGDTLKLTGTMESPFLGQRSFSGSIRSGRMLADLTRLPSGTKAGTIDAVRLDGNAPLRDYSALAAELESTIRAKVFDPALPSRPEFRRFFEELTRRAAQSRDDLDMVAAFEALKPSLGVSHFGFIRNPRLAARSLDEVIAGDPGVDPERFVQLGFLAPFVAFLDVTRWDRVTPAIDRAFERMAAAGTQVLILDIRGNPGGDSTSFAPVAHLIDEPATIGAILGRPWYESHRSPPSPSELAAMRAISADDPPAVILKGLRDPGAFAGKVLPKAPRFSGAVYLLIDARTGSASEPLAHTLKVLGRATLVGEPTAGRMLMALPTPLRDGWLVTIPEANFVTADGTFLENNGVEPHIKTAPERVFLEVADRIADKLPFSAEVVRGGSYLGLERLDDSERAYRNALRLADRQEPPPNAIYRANVHKRLAGIYLKKNDRPAALNEYREVLKLVPNDAEALAALKGGGEH